MGKKFVRATSPQSIRHVMRILPGLETPIVGSCEQEESMSNELERCGMSTLVTH